MPLSQALASLRDPVLPRILRRLPGAKTHTLFVFNALAARGGKLSGPSFHAHLAALVQDDVTDETDLWEWLQKRCLAVGRRPEKAFSAARKQADRWLAGGRWVAAWAGSLPPCEGAEACPRVLFGEGTLDADQKWGAVFNSRKPQLVSPHAAWLRSLRSLLELVAAHGLGFASSVETLSHDLVTVGADCMGARLLLFVPQALEAIGKATAASRLMAASFPAVVLSCLTMTAHCSKATRMLCRDRLLAFISDLHWVLEVRPGGNLWNILERQSRQQPRLVLHYSLDEGRARAEKEGRSGPGISRCREKGGDGGSQALRRSGGLAAAPAVTWHDYLYHYTRSCPGPWPGQSYRCYLESLLLAEPLAEHTAVAALGRILAEGRLRAGCRIVRGNVGVISWSARPPRELDAIRRWNAALIRWTFEPYGLAVKRSVLRRMGAEPAIYAAAAVYGRLPQQARFRFQRHDPPRCSWKSEREWRLPQDLHLRDLAPGEAFLFVPDLVDAERLSEYATAALPIVVVGSAGKGEQGVLPRL